VTEFVSLLKSLTVPGTNETYASRIKRLKGGVGNTPLDYIDTISGNKIFAKIEHFNPFSYSVKDRTATYMLTGPLERGEINPLDDKVWIESSSGNLGIAYGKIGVYLGLKTLIVMPSVVGETTYMRVLNSTTDCEITPGGYCPRGERDGAIKRAVDIWMRDPEKYELRDQYSNEDNIRAHEETTGPEFWRQTEGKITTLVLTSGTGGTIIGAARYFKNQNPRIEIVAVQQQKGHHIQGVRNFEESMKPIIFKDNEDLIDDWIKINDKEAFKATAYLWRKGYYEGTASGLNYAAARRLARTKKGRFIATLFPDSYMNSYKIIENFLTLDEIKDINDG